MLKTALKTSSALALCAGLVTPPAVAQTTEALPLCDLAGGDTAFPCVLEDGKEIKTAKALARVLARRGGAEQSDEGAATTAPLAPETAPADQPAPETAPADQAEAKTAPADQPAPETAPADQPAPDVVPTPETEPAEAPEEQPAPDLPQTPETEPADVPAEQPAPDVVPTPETEPADVPAEQPAAPTPDPAPAEAEAEEDSPKPQRKPEAETAPATQAPADRAAKTPKPLGHGGQQAAAAAAAEGDDELLDDPEAGAVTTETVTEADTRRSDEDFETAPTAERGAAAERGGGNSSNDSFQKALAIGLGALAVGAILYNGSKVISNSGDRVVVEQPDGTLTVLKNDDEILRSPGSEVRTKTFEDGSTRTAVIRENGVRIVTVRAADGTALKRVRVMPDGQRYVLFDDTVEVAPVESQPAPQTAAAGISATDQAALREALIASMADRDGRRYGLGQIRAYQSVRALAPEIEVRAITFPTNSAAIPPDQAERLADLGLAIADVIDEVPGAVFLVEGHTDAVGSGAYNLALSDRRAESVALALGEYFGVPPENLITQGYGESDLKVETAEANQQNRRVVVRNITPLLQ